MTSPSWRLAAGLLLIGLLVGSPGAVGSASPEVPFDHGGHAGPFGAPAPAPGRSAGTVAAPAGPSPTGSSGTGSAGGRASPWPGVPDPRPPAGFPSPQIPPTAVPAPSLEPRLTGPPTTEINGSAHINGSLTSSQNYLSGTVSIVGDTTTSVFTQTVGWADYGPTVVTGSISISPAGPGWGPVFTTHGGSSLWVDAAPGGSTGISVMQGNVSLGSSGASQGFNMDSTATLDIYADAAGGIYSLGGGTNLNSGSNIDITNFANSSGSITINGCTLLCPVTVGPGSSFTPCLIICISASSTSISWGADTYFQLTGSTTTSGSGVYATMPDTKMVVTVGSGQNLSLTPASGSPSVQIAPSLNWPAGVVAVGHTTVSGGEDLANADTIVLGTFQAVQNEALGGTFYNNGGVDITGFINAAGEQIFKHDLTLGPSVNITSFPGGNITNTGTIDINTVAQIQGLSVATGILNISGTLDQGAAINQINGTVQVNGGLSTQGYVNTTGSTTFLGNVLTSGNIALPNAFMTGSFALSLGSFVGTGSTELLGTTVCSGVTTITTAGFTASGGSVLTGDVRSTGSLVVSGSSVITTAPSAWFHLTSTVQMGVSAPGSWTTQSVGNLYTQGTSFSNGTATFGPSLVTFPASLSVHGTAWAVGNTTVKGASTYSGSVSTFGVSRFPGAVLVGDFALAAPGSVASGGTTWVSGNVSLVGLLTVGPGTFQEQGATTINGDLDIDGAATISGNAVIFTPPGGALRMNTTVQMGAQGGTFASQVVGSVLTQGTVFTNGTSTFRAGLAQFPPGLSAHGRLYAQGNVTVLSPSAYTGSVATTGTSRFPGAVLFGDFELASPGSVSVGGGSWVEGNVSLTGVLSVGTSSFSEAGATSILGYCDMDGPVTLTGSTEVRTTGAGAFHLNNTVQMGAQGGTFVSQVVGSVMTQGTIFANGTSIFTSTLASFPPGISVHGSVEAQGNVTVLAGATYAGTVSTDGVSQFPGATLFGAFQLTPGSVTPSTVVVNGTNWVEGNVSLSGVLSVATGSFTEVGSSSIVGYADMDGPVTIQGDSEIETGTGGAFHMTATILMGVDGASWTSRVIGTVSTRGTIFSNGTSSFSGSIASFPPGLSVHGEVTTQGNTTVQGATDFSGGVRTDGASRFPGMSLFGTFVLTAAGGSVNATGTSEVQGNISLDGVLSVGAGAFTELGDSQIVGNLTMTGNVVVNGDSSLTTSPGTLLELSGNIYLAEAAHIVGNVNTSGDVTIAGSAVLSPTSVVIGGSMSLNGTVTSRGIIALTGIADFQGPVSTQGHTALPGLDVAGNFSLHWGEFHLGGTVNLVGSTVAQGDVVTNSTGYYVVGTSRFDGSTSVVGAGWVRGASSTTGYVDLAGGSQFGTYMEVNGRLDTGGLDLQGPVILPDDTVTFSSAANITGSIWENGLLTSGNGAVTFVGTSIINGTVSSSGSPDVDGPVVLPLLGPDFALTLGPSFYLLIGALLVLPIVGAVELARYLRRRKHPLSEVEREAVRPLRPLVAGAGGGMIAGAALGLGGSFWLGSVLVSPSNGSSGGLVTTFEFAAAGLVLASLAVWAAHRVLYGRRRRHPPTRPQAGGPMAPEAAGPEAPAASSGTFVPPADDTVAPDPFGWPPGAPPRTPYTPEPFWIPQGEDEAPSDGNPGSP